MLMTCSLARLALIAAAGVAAFLAASPSMAAEAANGAELAQRWCTSCHVVSDTGQGTAQQGPPTFRSIARGGQSPDQLRNFLSHPHGSMPDLSLGRAEIDNLIAYIETLRGR
jgi:mono/diheme cytochrome c family protein